MRSSFLPFSPPSIGPDEVTAVVEALTSGWISVGPRTRAFEEQMREYIGVPAALGLNSCTAGLHLALKVLDVGPGDAVITTPMTFCASVNVIEHVGARPLLCDVDPDTLNISPQAVDECLERHAGLARSGRVKAMIPVHLYGHPCEMDALNATARQYGIAVVEDAAHALAARYKGRMVGTLGTCASFSFYATKNLTTAEGGLLTGDPSLIERARVLSLHGMSRDAWNRYTQHGSWYYEVVAPGFKYNMTDIAAALGMQQLRRLPGFQSRRREIARRYDDGLADVPGIERPSVRAEVEHAWHLYPIRIAPDAGVHRDEFIERMRELNIGTAVHFIPVHLHPYYREKYRFTPEDFPVASREYERIVSLPLHPLLSDDDVDDVIAAARQAVEAR